MGKTYKKHLKTLDFFHDHNVLLVLILIMVIHHFFHEYVYSSILKDTSGHFRTLKDTSGYSKTLQDTSGHSKPLQDTSGHFRTLQASRKSAKLQFSRIPNKFSKSPKSNVKIVTEALSKQRLTQ
jgi:hypothetical protein